MLMVMQADQRFVSIAVVALHRQTEKHMRWSFAGAQALLKLRAFYLNGDWNAFVEHHIQNEQAAFYAQAA